MNGKVASKNPSSSPPTPLERLKEKEWGTSLRKRPQLQFAMPYAKNILLIKI